MATSVPKDIAMQNQKETITKTYYQNKLTSGFFLEFVK